MFAVLPFPNIDPAAFTLPVLSIASFHVGPFPVRWYALAYIAGILLGWRYMLGLVTNERLWSSGQPRPNTSQCGDYISWATVGIIVGGRLGYVAVYDTSILWENPLGILAIWNGGMSFHGGLVGVAIATIWFASRNRLPLWSLADIVAASAPMGIGLVRVANFVNGELWGRPTDLPWGIVFPSAGALPRHPSQLYEALLEGVLLFAVLRYATHARAALKCPGLTAGLCWICYAIFRIAVETVREPDAQMPVLPLGLTTGMLLSAPMLIGGGVMVFLAYRGRLAARANIEST